MKRKRRRIKKKMMRNWLFCKDGEEFWVAEEIWYR
jgi:hypothetical protein